MKTILYKMSKKQFEQLQEDYKTDLKISVALGVSRSRISQIRKSLGLPIVKISAVNKRRNHFIKSEFSNSNVTRKELAEKYGLSLMTITRIINDKT